VRTPKRPFQKGGTSVVSHAAWATSARPCGAGYRNGCDNRRLDTQWMAFGMSTHKIGRALHAAFDCLVSPETINCIIAELHEEIAAFHGRPFGKGYRYLFLDGKQGCIKRYSPRSRRGGKRSRALAAGLGHRPPRKEELVDFRVALEASWTAFLTDLEARGRVRTDPATPRSRTGVHKTGGDQQPDRTLYQGIESPVRDDGSLCQRRKLGKGNLPDVETPETRKDIRIAAKANLHETLDAICPAVRLTTCR